MNPRSSPPPTQTRAQCLLATRPLREFLLADGHCKGCHKPGGAWCLLCELQDLCMRTSDDGGASHALSIRPLLRNIRMVAKGMAYGRQEDTHELFYSVVNTVESIQLVESGGKDEFDERCALAGPGICRRGPCLGGRGWLLALVACVVCWLARIECALKPFPLLLPMTLPQEP